MDPDVRHRNQVPRGYLKFFNGEAATLGGFAHVEVSKKQMTVTFIQARGTSLYRAVLKKRDDVSRDDEDYDWNVYANHFKVTFRVMLITEKHLLEVFKYL